MPPPVAENDFSVLDDAESDFSGLEEAANAIPVIRSGRIPAETLQARRQRRETVRWAVSILTSWIRILTALGIFAIGLYVLVMLSVSLQDPEPLVPLLITVLSASLLAASLFVCWAGSYLLVGAVDLLADIHEAITTDR